VIMKDIAKLALAKLREWGPDKCLLALTGVLAVLLLAQGVRLGLTWPLGRRLTRYLKSSSGALPQRKETKTLEAYDVILEKGVIGTKVKAKPPRMAVFGIMGNSALLGTSPQDAKPYEVGADLPQGGKLIEIGSDKVVLEVQGKQQTITVFPELKQRGPGQRGAPPGAPGPRGMPGPGPVPGPRGPAAAVAEAPQQGSAGAEAARPVAELPPEGQQSTVTEEPARAGRGLRGLEGLRLRRMEPESR
jgi:hypothetical protein